MFSKCLNEMYATYNFMLTKFDPNCCLQVHLFLLTPSWIGLILYCAFTDVFGLDCGWMAEISGQFIQFICPTAFNNTVQNNISVHCVLV